METAVLYIKCILIFIAIITAGAYLFHIRHWKANFDGRLPVKLIGIFTPTELDGTTSNRKRKYMKVSNAFLITIWICAAVGMLLFILSGFMHQ